MKPRICKDCKIIYTPYRIAQPRCKQCEYKRLKEKQKTYKQPQIKRNLQQEEINKQARDRDKNKPCISCGQFKKLEAGHYIAISQSQKLRYDLDNIHGQCMYCNRFLYGNQKDYRIGLIARYGEDFVINLETKK